MGRDSFWGLKTCFVSIAVETIRQKHNILGVRPDELELMFVFPVEIVCAIVFAQDLLTALLIVSLSSDSDGHFLLQPDKTYSFQFGFELPQAG